MSWLISPAMLRPHAGVGNARVLPLPVKFSCDKTRHLPTGLTSVRENLPAPRPRGDLGNLGGHPAGAALSRKRMLPARAWRGSQVADNIATYKRAKRGILANERRGTSALSC